MNIMYLFNLVMIMILIKTIIETTNQVAAHLQKYYYTNKYETHMQQHEFCEIKHKDVSKTSQQNSKLFETIRVLGSTNCLD